MIFHLAWLISCYNSLFLSFRINLLKSLKASIFLKKFIDDLIEGNIGGTRLELSLFSSAVVSGLLMYLA